MTSRTASPLRARTSSPGWIPVERCRRAGRHRHDTGGRHGAHPTGRPVTRPCRDGRARPIPSRACPSNECCSPNRAGSAPGVEMAIKALAWMVRVFEPPVYCYHEIVHNRLVVDRFRDLGRRVRRRRRRGARRRAAHALGPRVCSGRRRRRPQPQPVRRERGVPARHQGPPRGEGAGRQGFHHPLRRPRRPRRGDRHARGRARRDAARRARRGPRRRAPRGRRTPRRSPCWRRRPSRCTTGRASWTAPASSSPSCGRRRATTSASRRPTVRPRCTAIATRADAVVVIGSANSSNTIALTKVARSAGCPVVAARRRARRARTRRAGRRPRRRRHRRRQRPRGPRPGRDRQARPADGVEPVLRDRRGRVLPAASRAARARARARRARRAHGRR